MSILCIGDPHFTLQSMVNVDCFLTELQKHLQKNQYDIIVMLGDLLHDHAHLQSICLKKAVELINLLCKYCENNFALVGNHDATSNSFFLCDNHWMNCLKGIAHLTVVDKVIQFEFDSNLLTFVPYCPEGQLLKALSQSQKNWKQSKIIFGHQTLNGCKMGSILVDNIEEWKLDYPLFVSGHIHCKQTVQPNLIYTGSCLMHSFGEPNNKTLSRFNVSDTNIQHIEIVLDTWKKKLIYCDADYFKKLRIDTLDKKTLYKFSIEGSETEYKSLKRTKIYKIIIDNNHKIIFKPTSQNLNNQHNQHNNYVSNMDFLTILSKLVSDEKNDHLNNMFDHYIKQI